MNDVQIDVQHVIDSIAERLKQALVQNAVLEAQLVALRTELESRGVPDMGAE